MGILYACPLRLANFVQVLPSILPSSNFNFKLEDCFILHFSSHPPTKPTTHPEKVVLSFNFYFNFNPNLKLKLNLNLIKLKLKLKLNVELDTTSASACS